MNARRLSLLAGLVAIGWTLAWLRPATESSAPARAEPDREPATAQSRLSPGATRRSEAENAADAPGEEQTADRAQPQAQQSPEASQDPEQRRALLTRLATERHRRHDRRFDRAVERWREEKQMPRQEPWASGREAALQRALREDQINELATSLECRSLLCRIQFVASDDQLPRRVRGAHHFMREIGYQTAAGTIVEGDKQVMVLYAVRDGAELPAPPPHKPVQPVAPPPGQNHAPSGSAPKNQ